MKKILVIEDEPEMRRKLMTVRFVYSTHGTRSVKDAMSRDILAAFNAAGLRMASPVREIIASDFFKERGGGHGPG